MTESREVDIYHEVLALQEELTQAGLPRTETLPGDHEMTLSLTARVRLLIRDRRDVTTERRRADTLSAALQALIDWQGVEHQAAASPEGDAEDCPEDDTCRCPIVAQVNAALRPSKET